MLRHPGCPFFWSLFFGQAKKSDLPWVSHPQVVVEIARKARDTIQGLDSRFRGNDGMIGLPPSRELQNKQRLSRQ
jgi:hypothetical protein